MYIANICVCMYSHIYAWNTQMFVENVIERYN